MVPAQVSSLHHSALSSTGFQWFGFSSSASTEPSDKETMAHSGNEKEIKDSNEASSDTDDKSESGPDLHIYLGLSKAEYILI